ncbi:MAG TPA: peptide-methionine (R)-S-oxide reductase MsrB [Phycisphaerales bacterium]|nr:peptide-methionine (R)-S-oxide reductase MsrB [Phycisphaerales bacterium]
MIPLFAIVALAACSEGPPSATTANPPKEATTVATKPTPAQPAANAVPAAAPSSGKVVKSEAQWKQQLTPMQYEVLRQKGTERAFSGKYWDTKTPGLYKCAACGAVLFSSDAKFDSECGWPSFDRMIAAGTIEEHQDTSHGMVRTEVTCARCGGHLGHVFDDGPTSTHLRYCINSASIELEPGATKKTEGAPPTPANP